MRRHIVGLALALFLIHCAAAKAASSTLCRPGERVMFSCHLNQSGKIVSLCASPRLSPTRGTLHYRFGTANRVELTYPGKNEPAKAAFSLSHTQFIRSSAYGISFRNEGYGYYLEYLASSPDPKDDIHQLLVAKDGQNPNDVTIFEDVCDPNSIVGKSAFYPLESLSKKLGIPIGEVDRESD